MELDLELALNRETLSAGNLQAQFPFRNMKTKQVKER